MKLCCSPWHNVRPGGSGEHPRLRQVAAARPGLGVAWRDRLHRVHLHRGPGDRPAGRLVQREATTGLPLDQQALDFPVWRHHAVLTDRNEPLIDVEREHRAHAVVEQSIAELKQGPLAHLPSGTSGPVLPPHRFAARRVPRTPGSPWPR